MADAQDDQPGDAGTTRLPMFPLGSVVFPGLTVPLRVFEDRYRALVHHLLREPDPARRLFGSVAIREGYEVGDRGSQSLHRVGCRLQLTQVQTHEDGTFDVVAVCRDRLRLDRLDTSGTFPVGEVQVLPEPERPPTVDPAVVERTGALFAAHQAVVSELGGNVVAGVLPNDVVFRSWAMSAVAPLPLSDRQRLLETDDPEERYLLLADLFEAELRAINVIPSLPAMQLNRTGFSPN
ncbi:MULTISPECIES: LON peptidase substrate-binding domain-containing protein [unclassified Nocardioides]|uniref:LON peptidase substrate-binding domain-containing protein n=1 Tax=unclassified Nocardioides TaxID=2615069 RepID=UPI00240587DD|nr:MULTISPECIES: LON peptidase substrate-binding domain-containing protein [unclassified Nocardioides]